MARNTRSCLGSPAPAKPSRWPKSSKSWAVPHSLGFRLPSALDNRPLTFEQIEHRVNRVVYVSATPGPYKLTQTGGAAGEQIIGPTGLVDDLPLASGVNPALAGLETDSLPERSCRPRCGSRAGQCRPAKRRSQALENGLTISIPAISWPAFRSSVNNSSAPLCSAAARIIPSQKEICQISPISEARVIVAAVMADSIQTA